MAEQYNGGLTREQFLFYEIRIVASLECRGLERDEIRRKIRDDNLFQFPTEKMVDSITNTCFKRIDALGSESLIDNLASGTIESAKQTNLYAMMKYNRIVWDFMITVVGEKYRIHDFDFSQKDLNLFFHRLQEQDDNVASWSDSTIQKIKQVLKKSLIECDYLDSTRSEKLNQILITPELEDGIREKHDLAALPAFNCFM